MKLKEIYTNNKNFPLISFEVFPPKSDDKKLIEEIKVLKQYTPQFISLTYGAGGNGNKSFELLNIIRNLGINVVPHFTCITSSKKSVNERLIKIEKSGIENILALRGDIPTCESDRHFDFNYANELVAFIKDKTNLSIGVAGYPEGHIESPDLHSDILNLKKKVNAGADVIFTQLFFDNKKFYNYTEILREKGINLPVIAGIMPIISKNQLQKMTSMARVTIPNIINEKAEKYADDPISLRDFGIDYATEQCLDLIKNNVEGLHFFTLNKSYSTAKILENIKGVR